ncbi:hypothetical protein DFQ28_005463 [Apophysomyces sp. BC1034]|nr:hypothetical protein DFQ30_005546 [Apophysomyces sp. BC1015]KAG0188035.1 hypothetical protein DFQ28_005463 [Apophysomyces sp. BC1034]
MLLVYHKHGDHFKKRGEIINLQEEPVYVSTHEEELQVDNPNALYQVKVKDERSGNIILSSVKYCQLLASDWKDEFRVHLDDADKVYHVDYFADGTGCNDQVKLPAASKPFSSRITLKKPIEGPKSLLGHSNGKSAQQKRPATKAEEQRENEPKEEEPEQSFFQKYWYLLVVGALLFLSTASPPPEQQQQRQQRQ